MKRRFTILTAAIALLAIFAIPMGMMGQTKTNFEFNLNELYQDGTLVTAKTVITESGGTLTFTDQNENFTILLTRNSGNQPGFYTGSGYFRFYNSDTFKLSAADGITMTQITVTSNGTSFSVADMEGLNASTKTWTGSASEVTFTGSGTNKWDKLTITYSSGGSQTNTYTVTYNANVAGTASIVDTYAEGANVTLRDANTFTNEGYTFSEWNTQADGDGDPYDAGDVIENIQANIELYAIWTENATSDDHWVLTDLANLTANDVFVIVGNNGFNYAMKNTDASNSGPAAIAVTVSGTEISGTVPDNIKWNISGNATDGYIFYPNGSTTTWLYCTNNNNGLRIGSGNTDYNTFEIKASYIYNKGRGRYLGIYNSTDWRSYTTIGSNIANQTFAFYKKVSGTVPPSITANNVEIAYDATSGEIAYTLNNPATNGNLSVSANVDWISNLVFSTTESKVTFTTTANEVTTAREGIITITYTYGDNETVSKDVTVTQAAAPVIYTTIPALFNAATSTATDVNVTFGGWVVSAVKGSNAYLTDNQGNGLIIYASEHGFQVNDVLTGTASCKLQLYRGSAELTTLTTSTEGLTVANNGTVTEANIAMANLTGVNTGALVSYENLVCSVTTSGNYTNYDLTDGTTTIRAYTTLYDFTTTPDLENGKTYNIKGIFVQYNTTKEIMPRSAADIEEVVTPVQDYDLTVEPFENLELITFVNDEMVMQEDGTVQITEGDHIMLSIVADEGYVMETLMVNGVNHVNDIADDFTYEFDMPGENVTISATAVEAPTPTGDRYVKVTSSDNLTDGQYLIVYEEGGLAFDGSLETLDVAGNTIVVTISNNEIAATDETVASEFTINVTEGTIKSASGYYIGRTSDTNGMLTNETEVYTNTISIDEEGNADILASGGAYLRYNPNSGQTRFRYFKSSSYTNQKAIQLYKKVETPVTETYTLDITGYGDNDGGYYLIASPVAKVTPSIENNFITDAFDLYWFDQTQDNEWKNYESVTFDLVSGMGYLYASQDNTTLTFVGTPYDGDGSVSLVKDDEAQFAGWNLVGNPFADSAYIDRDFYIMNPQTGKDLIHSNGVIAAMQGIFVSAIEDGESLTFSTEPYRNNGKGLVMNVTGNRGNVIDRAVVRFGESRNLRKFQLFENSTRISISQDNSDYAVVRSDAQGEMPVNFKASENGTYTLSFNTENVEMDYLHLIDNMTGNNIDLLANPSYSFEANTSDYTSRFRLVFAAGNNEMGNDFAFVSNGQIIVNGQGTVEVYDLTGRMISRNNDVTSIATDDMSAGVYMIRLTNGTSVKTQKIVVK